MLQQTRVEVVLPYFARFLARFPDLASLAAASEDEVTAAWSGLGYYRRAKMLRAGAEAVMEQFGGVVPSRVSELLTIPGVGRYTAGAIASIAWQERSPIVDGNVARVLARVFGHEGDPWPIAEELAHACKSPRALNQGLMELGALVCKPRNPACLLCPLHDHCIARMSGRIDELPPPKAKKATRSMRIPLYVVRDRRGRLLVWRASGPLMDAMIHLPHGDDSLLDCTPIAVRRGRILGTFRHTVTTRRIEFTVYAAALRGRAPRGYRWIDPRKLPELPHPSYVKKALRYV